VEHVVFFPSSDGSPAFSRVPSVEDAVRLVEHLRNVEGVSEATVHQLVEVPLSFRAYYHVEVPGAEAAPAPAAVPQPEVARPLAPVLELVPQQSTEPAVEAAEPAHAVGAEAPAHEAAPAATYVPDAFVVEAQLAADLPAELPAGVPAGEAPRSLGFFA
jgi:hypothetical protein